MASSPSMYLNHAGTSWPKPEAVRRAYRDALLAPPEQWADLFDAAADDVGRFFHVDPARLLFTPSCTAALNVAIFDLPWQPGDRILTSDFEHHALHRNLQKLERFGVNVIRIPSSDHELLDLERLEAELQPDAESRQGAVRLVAMTAACNVTGRLLPVERAVELAHRYGSLILIDGAQIAGWWDLNLQHLGADFFTFAGHKGPQALTGIGGLYVAPGIPLDCSTASCTIDASDSRTDEMPGYCDVGSVNLPALVSLAAGCRWLAEPARGNRLHDVRQLAECFAAALRPQPKISLLHDTDFCDRLPTVAFTVDGHSSSAVRKRLAATGVIVSSGLQCAPLAHQALGTAEAGVVRCSFGITNDLSHAEIAAAVLATL